MGRIMKISKKILEEKLNSRSFGCLPMKLESFSIDSDGSIWTLKSFGSDLSLTTATYTCDELGILPPREKIRWSSFD